MISTIRPKKLPAIALILTLALTGRAAVAAEEGDGTSVVVLHGEPGTRARYDFRITAPSHAQRAVSHEERLRGGVVFSEDGTARVDLGSVRARVPGWDPRHDTLVVEGHGASPESGAAAGQGHLPAELQHNASLSTPGGSGPAWYIRRDVPGPAFDGLGNNAEDFTVDHHAFVVENTRSTQDDGDGASLNTGGIAIVLHSDGEDDLSIFDLASYDADDHILNTVNRNDHFLTFFREDADGVRDIVGRVEGLSFWDMGEISQEVIDFFADSGHLPWNWFDLNVTFNDPATWLQWTPPTLSHPGFEPPDFERGSLPIFAYNNTDCEGNANEVCLTMGSINVLGTNYNLGEIDTTFSRGSLPAVEWGSLDEFLFGLQLDPGSISATPPIEFGSPFLQVNESVANQFAHDLEDFFGSTAPIALEMKTEPVAFAAKYLFALRGGVTYESGSGDYAEWLERLDAGERLQAGEIVGVHGGKISKNTEGADQTMVVSYKPIVLGNMPPEERRDRFEKVAFMGQTLVQVIGVVRKGDYILPSGRGDGTGVAVTPADIRAGQLSSVVGIAWGEGGAPGRLGLVNVAVGLRPVEVTRVVAAQQASLDAMREEYARVLGELERLKGSVESLLAVRVAGAGR